MRDSILRVIDDLETKIINETKNSDHEDYKWVPDEMYGLRQGYEYAIQELRKVLDDAGKKE